MKTIEQALAALVPDALDPSSSTKHVDVKVDITVNNGSPSHAGKDKGGNISIVPPPPSRPHRRTQSTEVKSDQVVVAADNLRPNAEEPAASNPTTAKKKKGKKAKSRNDFGATIDPYDSSADITPAPILSQSA